MSQLGKLQRAANEAGRRWSDAVQSAEKALDEYRTANTALLEYMKTAAADDERSKQQREQEESLRLSYERGLRNAKYCPDGIRCTDLDCRRVHEDYFG